MSISQNFPNTRPSLNLNFARSQTLDPRITFTRTTSGTRVGPDGYIEVIPADQPRFDHDPETGECLGLLVEEQRSNLLTYSEDWSAYQAKQSLDVTINDITSPDGAETADKLQCNASGLSNDGFIQKLQTVTASTKTYTTSWFVKRGNTDRTNLSTALSGGTYLAVYAYIDWTNSPVSFNYDGNNGNPGYIVHPLEEYPNGWYRASISISNNNTNTQITNRIYASSRSSTVSGDYVYAWGSQAEEGSFPTSYIPRPDTSTATRNPDSVTMTGDNFSEWYNPSEGTVYVKYSIKGLGTNSTGFNRIFEIFDSESLNRLTALLLTNDQIYESFIIGTQQMDYRPFTINFNEFNEYVIGFGTESQRYAYNASGVLSGNTDNSIGISTFYPNQLNIGFQFDNTTRYLNGYISQFTYYPVRLSNSQLQNLILR